MGVENSTYMLKINLSKQTFIPGEIINGTFNFELKKGQKNAILTRTNVILSFLTIEEIYYHIRKKRESTFGTAVVDFPQLFEVKNNPNIKIPFQIQIPINMQPSFEYHRHNMDASYRNFLKIQIPEIKAEGTIYINIKKLSTPLNTPLNLVERTHSKTLFSSSDTILNVKYNKNSYAINSQIPFTFSIDFSQAKFNIKELEFTLKRKIKFFDDKRKSLGEEIDELQNQTIPGNKSKEQTENLVAYLNDPQEIYKKYAMNNLSEISGIKPNEAINFIPSMKAVFFECEYYIKVRAKTDANILSGVSTPSLKVPLDVFQADNSNTNLNVRQSAVYQQIPIDQSYMQPQMQRTNTQKPIQNPIQQPQIQIQTIHRQSMQQTYIPPIQASYIPPMQQSYIPPIQQPPIQQSYIPPMQNPPMQQSYIPPMQQSYVPPMQQPTMQQSYIPPMQNPPMQPQENLFEKPTQEPEECEIPTLEEIMDSQAQSSQLNNNAPPPSNDNYNFRNNDEFLI